MLVAIATKDKSGELIYNSKPPSLPPWTAPILAGIKSIHNQELYVVAEFHPPRLINRRKTRLEEEMLIYFLPMVFRMSDGNAIHFDKSYFFVRCRKPNLNLEGKNVSEWNTDGQLGSIPVTKTSARRWKNIFVSNFNQWNKKRGLYTKVKIEEATKAYRDWEDGYSHVNL